MPADPKKRIRAKVATRQELRPLSGSASSAAQASLNSSAHPAVDKSRLRRVYDFLYCDRERFHSYYAQVNTGRLASTEKTGGARDNTETGGTFTAGGGAVPVAINGSTKAVNEVLTGYKTTIDPHDQIILDVLAFFRKHNMICSLEDSENGELVQAIGSVHFAEESLLKMALKATLPNFMSNVPPNNTLDMDHATQVLLDWFSTGTLPSSFSLHCQNQVKVVGMIKDAGMQEPITSYYFRHGPGGLQDVTVIGIKETTAASTFPIQGKTAADMGRQFADGFQQLYFPEDAHRVTPLLIYREIRYLEPEPVTEPKDID